MGNCQAVDAAALVIQHPNGKAERHYWPVSACEVMKNNPGFHVSPIIPSPASDQDSPEKKTIRYTRVKLLRPTDTLLLGHAYRLITSQEVMKVLRAKNSSKRVTLKKNPESERRNSNEKAGSDQGEKVEQGQVKVGSMRARSWRPSLQSISEASS